MRKLINLAFQAQSCESITKDQIARFQQCGSLNIKRYTMRAFIRQIVYKRLQFPPDMFLLQIFQSMYKAKWWKIICKSRKKFVT